MKSGEQPDRSPDRPYCYQSPDRPYCYRPSYDRASYDRASYDRASYDRASYDRASYRISEPAPSPPYRSNREQLNFGLADLLGTVIALVSLTLPLLTISSYSQKIVLPQPATQLLKSGN